MNWLRRTLLIVMAFLMGCAISAFAMTAGAAQNHPLKIWAQNENGSFQTLCVVDDNTGVNYVVVSRYSAQRGANSVAICPRYNADGTLYVSGG